jgi:hypothetical protein
MRSFFFFLAIFLISLPVHASDKDSTINYTLPDSVRAVSYMADITVNAFNEKKGVSAGIKTDKVSVTLHSSKKSRWVSFDFVYSKTAARFPQILVMGLDAREGLKSQVPEWNFYWEANQTYRLLIAQAADSAGNFSVYSGYIFLPKANKWKLIGTCKIFGAWSSIKSPASFSSSPDKYPAVISVSNIWCQRSSGSWKNLLAETLPAPTVNLFSHVDSIRQSQMDTKIIQDSIAAGRTDVKDMVGGIYYKIIKEGTGRQVVLTDTVTVNYKLTIFNDGSLVQETTRPATFTLGGLIKGWQLGVPLCKVGGKIKLVIPSALGYSIRTRSAKIPPNSILVFEIEVLEAKEVR